MTVDDVVMGTGDDPTSLGRATCTATTADAAAAAGPVEDGTLADTATRADTAMLAGGTDGTDETAILDGGTDGTDIDE